MSRDEMVQQVAKRLQELWESGRPNNWSEMARAAVDAMYDYQADHRLTEVEQDADWWAGA
jgi:Arc/MetJ-type ribon-helix-helix transcriptional regulator